MRPVVDVSTQNPQHPRPGRALWIALIVITGICLSTVFACVTPFAALATLAALKLGPRDAITIVGLVWLANQAIGYGFLGYPWTWDSGAWGLVIGVSAGLAFLVARGLSTTRPAPFAVSLPFMGAFAAFELGLYGAGFVLPGSDGAFAASVVWHVFLLNAISLGGLMAAYYLAMVIGYLVRHDTSAYRAAGA
jgi:hypothetical protein